MLIDDRILKCFLFKHQIYRLDENHHLKMIELVIHISQCILKKALIFLGNGFQVLVNIYLGFVF